MAFRSIAARFWLSFSLPTKSLQRFCARSGLVSNIGVFQRLNTCNKKWQHQVTSRKTPNKMAKASQLRSFLGYIFIYIYILFICCLWLQTKTSKSFFSVTSAMPHVVTGSWHCWHWLSPAMGHRANLSLGYVSRSTLRMIRQRFSWPLGISLYKRARRLAVLLGTKKSHLVQQKAQLLTDTPEQTKTWKKWKQC